MVGRRAVLGAVGAAAVGVAAGGVALARHEDRPSATDWHVVLTRLANGLAVTPPAVAAAALAPAPQLLVGIPLTVAEAAELRARRGQLAVYEPEFDELRHRTPAMTTLSQGYGPPSARTLHAWLTAPDRAIAEQLRTLVRSRVPVEVRLTPWTRRDLDGQYAALSARSSGLTAEQGIEFSSIADGGFGPVISVLTTRPLDIAQRRAVRLVAPAAVFSVGTASPA